MYRNRMLHAGFVSLLFMIVSGVQSQTCADSGTVRLSVFKAGWFVGANGGGGTLYFHGRRYALSAGGIDAGLVFGLSHTALHGRVLNVYRPSDIAGVYGAAGAGATIGVGARVIKLVNEKGAILLLDGTQIGLMANIDLSGLVIGLR